MPDKAYRESVPVVLFITAISMVLGAFAIVLVLLINNRQEVLVNRKNGLINQTYVRSTNCFQAIPAAERTDQTISRCYDQAEHATGMKVERYGGISK